jgi:hypothetical protein
MSDDISAELRNIDIATINASVIRLEGKVSTLADRQVEDRRDNRRTFEKLDVSLDSIGKSLAKLERSEASIVAMGWTTGKVFGAITVSCGLVATAVTVILKVVGA